MFCLLVTSSNSSGDLVFDALAELPRLDEPFEFYPPH